MAKRTLVRVASYRRFPKGKNGDAQSFAQQACSGSDNISVSAYPLRRRSRRSGPLRILTLTDFHKISRAEGPSRQYKGRPFWSRF